MDRFSQLIKDGVARFEYKSFGHEISDTCPICRQYNNLYGMASDTHMSTLEDGRKVITGQLIRTPKKFDQFLYSYDYLGAIKFTECPSCFLYRNRLKGHYDILNGDQVYILDEYEGAACPGVACTACVCAMEGGIPQSVRFIATDGKFEHVQECMDSEDPIKSLNESKYIKGNNWIVIGLENGDYLYEATNKIIIK